MARQEQSATAAPGAQGQGHAADAAPEQLYVAAIGASAGGLEAINDFLDNMPDATGTAFVIIQHLSPDHKSLLAELISRHTAMQVQEAAHGLKLRPNNVYVIPPGKMMTVKGGALQLTDKAHDKQPNTAIDEFFISMAASYGPHCIAVILSGTGTDGSRGAEAIQNAGGLVLVQEPETARFDGMPRSAISLGRSDAILPPELMPEEILNHIQGVTGQLFGKQQVDEALLEKIFALLYRHTGCDFHQYKLPTILRRISRRLQHHNLNGLQQYIEHLEAHHEECRVLCQEFLIGVTKFFRDPEAFEALEQKVLPHITSGKDSNDVLKVWITACSTGEEAYSFAILIDRFLRRRGKSLVVKIFATDIDGRALEIASRGSYPLSIEKDIPADILQDYFVREDNRYLVRHALRKQIVFAQHNLIKDPPFIRNDLVSCRNMLIYMTTPLQRRILEALHFSLLPGGFMMLGPSETCSGLADSVEEADRRWKIYRRGSASAGGSHYSWSKPLPGERRELNTPSFNNNNRRSNGSQPGTRLQQEFRETLAEELGYAALYINRRFEVKEATGDFRRYLRLPEKNLTLNLLKMLPADLAATVSRLVRKTWSTGSPTSARNVPASYDTELALFLSARPARHAADDEITLLLIGENRQLSEGPRLSASDMPVGPEAKEYISELQVELADTRSHLQTAIENLESTNEELQSSNEELLSSNEELQSSNEELQSLNEELHTLNTEHQLKISELIELNDDLNNYFRSNDIGQIFLDSRLRVRKFNASARRFVNLIDSDTGRSFEHFTNNFRQHNLPEDIRSVMAEGTVFERELELRNGQACLLRILPYVRQDGKTDGVVLTFVDISSLKDLDNIVKGVFNSSQSGLLTFVALRNASDEIIDFKLTAANGAAVHLLGKEGQDLHGLSLNNGLTELTADRLVEKCSRVVQTDHALHQEFRMQQGEAARWLDLTAVKMMDGVAMSLTDISEKREAEERLRRNYNELIGAREELKKLNSELESEVHRRTAALSESEERFRIVTEGTNDVIWDWSLIDNSIWLSASYYRSFGYTEEDSSSRAQWLSRIHPEDRQRVAAGMSAAINGSTSNWTAEYRYRHADGSYAHILDRGYVMQDENGMPFRMLGSMLDVSELRRAEREIDKHEEEMRFLADAVPQMVWTARPDGTVDYFNQRWFDYTGQDAKAGNLSWIPLLHPDDVQPTLDVWEESVKTGKPYQMEYRFKDRRSPGRYRWFLGQAQAFRDDDNVIQKWFGTCTDINEQKQQEHVLEERIEERTQELRKTNEQLEASNVDLQQFASVASHDLKEPLRKIQMFGKLMQERFGTDMSESANSYLERIIASSSRMTALINSLLQFSRLSSDTAGGMEATDLNEILRLILSDLELTIAEKGAQIEADALPVIRAIPNLIRQVFQNLISNALKFTKEGVPPCIRIVCQRIAGRSFSAPPQTDGPFLRIEVRDNGIGFDEQYLNKIFVIFQQLHTRNEYEGTGIGLAICKKIIERHHGLITAHSSAGEGATFEMVLPVLGKGMNDE